jgi:hypothetical protein
VSPEVMTQPFTGCNHAKFVRKAKAGTSIDATANISTCGAIDPCKQALQHPNKPLMSSPRWGAIALSALVAVLVTSRNDDDFHVRIQMNQHILGGHPRNEPFG